MRRTLPALCLTLLLAAGCTSDGGTGSPFGSVTTTPTTDPGTTASPGSTTEPAASSTTAARDGSTETTASTTETTAAPSSTDSTTTTAAPTTTTSTTEPPTTTTTTLSPRPVPLREGLASFDTYEFTLTLLTAGPTQGESNQMAMTIRSDAAAKRRHMTVEATVTTVEDGPSTTTTDTIQVVDDACTYDGDAWTYEKLSPQQRELADIVSSLMDIAFATDDGILVETGTVAGLPARHYRYSLPGLGQESGALVVENQVDYWVSDDGNVLVRYRAVIETRSGPSTDPASEILGIETTTELVSVNQPLTIELPADCPVV